MKLVRTLVSSYVYCFYIEGRCHCDKEIWPVRKSPSQKHNFLLAQGHWFGIFNEDQIYYTLSMIWWMSLLLLDGLSHTGTPTPPERGREKTRARKTVWTEKSTLHANIQFHTSMRSWLLSWGLYWNVKLSLRLVFLPIFF